MGATDRIKEYLEIKGITKYAFYKQTGFSNKFLDNSSNMGTDRAEIILRYYPDISADWLITGKEPMLRSSEATPSGLITQLSPGTTVSEQQVPVYEMMGAFTTDDTPPSSGYISLPNLPRCDGAIRMWGDKMKPDLMAGDLLVYRKVKDLKRGLFLDQLYIISLEVEGVDYVFVQLLTDSKEPNCVKMVSKNERYPPKDIPLDSIKALAMVKASVRYNTML